MTVMWLTDPDTTAHEKGIGDPATIECLRKVDAEIKRIQDGLAASVASRTTTSGSHPTTVSAPIPAASRCSKILETVRAPDARRFAPCHGWRGRRDLRPRSRSRRHRATSSRCCSGRRVSARFSPSRPNAGSRDGWAPGTLSFDAIRWTHERSAEICFRPTGPISPTPTGFAARIVGGVAGHGSASPFDVHNTLIAAGPDLKTRHHARTPSGNVDFAPTLLALAGIPAPTSMQGRMLSEAFVNGPEAGAVASRSDAFSVKTADGIVFGDRVLFRCGVGWRTYRYFDWAKADRKWKLARPAGFEPATFGFGGQRSNPAELRARNRKRIAFRRANAIDSRESKNDYRQTTSAAGSQGWEFRGYAHTNTDLRLGGSLMRWLNAFVVGVLMLTSPAAAQRAAPPIAATTDVLPFKATERTLPNGLKVIVVPTGFPNLVSIEIPVQTGSRNEVEPGKSGFAHFFEHLMFRGTPDTPPEKYRDDHDARPARATTPAPATTRTHYYATFAKEHLEPVLALYADMFQNLAYSEADFKTEARAILGEYNKNSADPTREALRGAARRVLSGAHLQAHDDGLHRATSRTCRTSTAYSKVFFERWYRPQYTTMIVAGDVTPEQVLPLVEKYWGGWKAGARGAGRRFPQEPAPQGPLYVHVPWTSDTLPDRHGRRFRARRSTRRARTRRRWRCSARCYFGPTSELYKKLVVAEQKVDALDVDVPIERRPVALHRVARVKKPQTPSTCAIRSSRRSRHARATGLSRPRGSPTRSRTTATPSRARSTAPSASRRSSSRYAVVQAVVRHRERLLPHARRRSTPADMQAAARKYFTDSGLIVTTLAKEPLPAGIERTAGARSVKPPRRCGSRAPARRRRRSCRPRLRQHASLLVLQKSVLPQLDVKLLFTVGSAHDPAGKEGLAALTAAMIAEAGSQALTIEQIERVALSDGRLVHADASTRR